MSLLRHPRLGCLAQHGSIRRRAKPATTLRSMILEGLEGRTLLSGSPHGDGTATSSMAIVSHGQGAGGSDNSADAPSAPIAESASPGHRGNGNDSGNGSASQVGASSSPGATETPGQSGVNVVAIHQTDQGGQEGQGNAVVEQATSDPGAQGPGLTSQPIDSSSPGHQHGSASSQGDSADQSEATVDPKGGRVDQKVATALVDSATATVKKVTAGLIANGEVALDSVGTARSSAQDGHLADRSDVAVSAFTTGAGSLREIPSGLMRSGDTANSGVTARVILSSAPIVDLGSGEAAVRAAVAGGTRTGGPNLAGVTSAPSTEVASGGGVKAAAVASSTPRGATARGAVDAPVTEPVEPVTDAVGLSGEEDSPAIALPRTGRGLSEFLDAFLGRVRPNQGLGGLDLRGAGVASGALAVAGLGETPEPSNETSRDQSPCGTDRLAGMPAVDLSTLDLALRHYLDGADELGGELAGWLAADSLRPWLFGAAAAALACLAARRWNRKEDELALAGIEGLEFLWVPERDQNEF